MGIANIDNIYQVNFLAMLSSLFSNLQIINMFKIIERMGTLLDLGVTVLIALIW